MREESSFKEKRIKIGKYGTLYITLQLNALFALQRKWIIIILMENGVEKNKQRWRRRRRRFRMVLWWACNCVQAQVNYAGNISCMRKSLDFRFIHTDTAQIWQNRKLHFARVPEKRASNEQMMTMIQKYEINKSQYGILFSHYSYTMHFGSFNQKWKKNVHYFIESSWKL